MPELVEFDKAGISKVEPEGGSLSEKPVGFLGRECDDLKWFDRAQKDS
ncbi:MAG: hypothetical protein MRJ67_03330 [Nitrospirales bacterium]|nr:hypothetical protein [Nitrospirales bacterium]MDR4484332.1 hypothetical protein [Nitrospirales bacterium]MDR4484645.1 hypothetical protein [Nitrospirales bacterium]